MPAPNRAPNILPFTPKRKPVCVDPRPIPERRAVVRFKSGHVLRINHALVVRVLAIKTEVDLA